MEADKPDFEIKKVSFSSFIDSFSKLVDKVELINKVQQDFINSKKEKKVGNLDTFDMSFRHGGKNE